MEARHTKEVREMIQKFIQKLDNIDPMPWNQAWLMAIAFVIVIALAVFGNYLDDKDANRESNLKKMGSVEFLQR